MDFYNSGFSNDPSEEEEEEEEEEFEDVEDEDVFDDVSDLLDRYSDVISKATSKLEARSGKRKPFRKKHREEDKIIAGLTSKHEIDGVTVSTNRNGAVMECWVTLLASEKPVSMPIRIHLSLQRHWWNAMDSTEAKPKNSLMLPKIQEKDIKEDLEEVGAVLGEFFKTKPSKFPKSLKATTSSGRKFTLDTLTMKSAHCFVTGGTDVVYLPHGEFVSLKSVRDLSERGRPVYINKIDRNETVGIIERHGCAKKDFFKKAAIFPIDAEVLTLLLADLNLA